jgi:hypothetical protein
LLDVSERGPRPELVIRELVIVDAHYVSKLWPPATRAARAKAWCCSTSPNASTLDNPELRAGDFDRLFQVGTN